MQMYSMTAQITSVEAPMGTQLILTSMIQPIKQGVFLSKGDSANALSAETIVLNFMRDGTQKLNKPYYLMFNGDPYLVSISFIDWSKEGVVEVFGKKEIKRLEEDGSLGANTKLIVKSDGAVEFAKEKSKA